MITVIILSVIFLLLISMIFFSKKLSQKVIVNRKNEEISLLIDELRDIKNIKLESVSSEIMYSKTFSVILMAYTYVFSIWFIALILDILTAKTLNIFDDTLTPFFLTGILFLAVNIAFILPLSSATWKYTYFKYGITTKLQHIHVVSNLINLTKKRLLINYIIVSCIFYLLGRFLFGAGVFSVEAGSLIYAIGIYIYFHLEVERIGFAPIFNAVVEKLDALKVN